MLYRYCGLVIDSDITFPFFKETSEQPLIKIVVKKNYTFYNQMPAVFLDDGKIIVNFGEDGYYVIEKNKIVCHFIDEKIIRATICNLPIAIIALLNNLLPIHCASVITKNCNKVVLFLGKKGAGKSTLAFNLNKYMSYHIYGDDVVSANSIDDVIYINHGTSSIKLCKDILAPCHDNLINVKNEVYAGWDKYYYTPREFKNIINPLQLKDIFIIERGAELATSTVPEFLNKSYIINNIVGISYISEILSKEILLACNNLSKYRIKKLIIPEGIPNLTENLICISKIIERC